MFGRMRVLLYVLAVEGILTAAVNVQLLDANECGVGYQYRSPPEELLCKANITLTRLNCLVAFPSSTPINTRVEVRWYWRNLEDAAAGSNTAIEVNHSHFLTVNTACDRGTSCPDAMYNLTANISQLEIEGLSSNHQGDYMCRILVINETSGELQQALHPSACVRLLVTSGINQNCLDMGERTEWRCADTDQQTGECPQLFSQYPVPSPSSSVAEKSSSASVISPFQSTMSLFTDSTTTVNPPPISSSVVISIPASLHITPTSTRTGTQDTIATTLYVSVSLGALIIVIIGVVSTTIIIIILGMHRMKKRNTQNHSDNEEKSSSVNGEAVHNEGTTNEYSNGSGKEVKRISSIYSKPVRVAEQSKVDPKNHKYANPVVPDKEDQRSSAVYSFPFQHHMHRPIGSEGAEETCNGYQNTGDDGYQNTGDHGYTHMNPSPLLVGKATQSAPEDGEYERMILNKETPSVPSPYIEPVQSLAKSD